MDTKFIKPKGFGEILDHTFSLIKNHFKDFFTILIIFMGPVYLLQAIIQLASGNSFFRNMGSGNTWLERVSSSFTEAGTFDSSSFEMDFSIIVVALFSLLLFPVAEAAILFALHHLRKNEEYTVGSVIKQAFTRYWPMLGSGILFSLISGAIVTIPIILIFAGGFIVSDLANPIAGIIMGIFLFLGLAVGISLILTRLSFYFGSVVLDKESPGLFRSWRLSKQRTWVSLGLYIVFYLIVTSMSMAVEFTFGAFLGNSVLLTLISNLASVLTTMVFSVGFGVMYLDLKTRHDAEDLKELIEDYNKI